MLIDSPPKPSTIGNSNRSNHKINEKEKYI